ncbi:MAG: hypothetical protein U9N50_07360, partial [Pseudomonadota bacterium]|nr:hypothetical protein [Pseudomonadota bacterium]
VVAIEKDINIRLLQQGLQLMIAQYVPFAADSKRPQGHMPEYDTPFVSLPVFCQQLFQPGLLFIG